MPGNAAPIRGYTVSILQLHALLALLELWEHCRQSAAQLLTVQPLIGATVECQVVRPLLEAIR